MKNIEWSQKWQVLSLILAVGLAISVGFNTVQFFNVFGGATEPASTNVRDDTLNFTFTWGSDTQKVVNGTLKLEVTFLSWKDNASMIVRINDDDYQEWDWIALVFDRNENGVIEEGELTEGLYANNLSRPAFLKKNGFLCFAQCIAIPGLHNVTFDNETGYTFRIQYPLRWDGLSTWDPADVLKQGAYNPLHICFSEGVFVQFSFYLPEEA